MTPADGAIHGWLPTSLSINKRTSDTLPTATLLLADDHRWIWSLSVNGLLDSVGQSALASPPAPFNTSVVNQVKAASGSLAWISAWWELEPGPPVVLMLVDIAVNTILVSLTRQHFDPPFPNLYGPYHAVDRDDQVYALWADTVWRFDSTGQQTGLFHVSADEYTLWGDMDFDALGSLWIVEHAATPPTVKNRLLQVNATTGETVSVTLIDLDGSCCITSLAVDSAGTAFVAATDV